MAKKVFLIEWQRGIGLNKSAKSFHSLNPNFTEHIQLWQDVEELRADWRWEIQVHKDHLDQIKSINLFVHINKITVMKKELKWSAISGEGFKLTILAAGSAEACGAVTKLAGSLPTAAPVEANTVATHRWNIKKKKKKEINKKILSECIFEKKPSFQQRLRRLPENSSKWSEFNPFHEKQQHRCSRVTLRIKSQSLQGHCGSSVS